MQASRHGGWSSVEVRADDLVAVGAVFWDVGGGSGLRRFFDLCCLAGLFGGSVLLGGMVWWRMLFVLMI